MKKEEYTAAFTAILEPHRVATTSISPAILFAHAETGSAKETRKRQKLKDFLSEHPEYVGVVQGVLPSVDAIIGLAEAQLGAPVSESNVVQANVVCKDMVQKAAAPVLEEFIRSGLGSYIKDDCVSAPIRELVEFLAGDFASFAKGAGNSLISIAGSFNEKLLVKCLEEKGMKAEQDFTATGTESEGDIVVHSHSGTKLRLNVEIKSYHARERLLRGLRDVQRPKVGAGYFIDANEFNASRTVTLLDTNAAAIYMPGVTLSALNMQSQAATTNDPIAYGSLFYRPLERFASDMQHFVSSGQLPPIKSVP